MGRLTDRGELLQDGVTPDETTEQDSAAGPVDPAAPSPDAAADPAAAESTQETATDPAAQDRETRES